MTCSFIFKMTFSILGGLGIFLLGMKNMSEGMQAVAGDRIQKLINAVTNNRLIACGVGLSITMLIQSSSVTTVMVVGMVNAGLMNLTQAIGVILGADIGTTITGWILVLKITHYGFPIMGAAAFFFLFSKKEGIRYTSMMIMGLGMVFFGLMSMKEGFAPLREMPEFIEWFSRFHPDTYFGVIKCCVIGTVITAIVQSSSATLGITMGLVGSGVLDFETAAAIVLGQNIGTTITACLGAIGASADSKRAAAAHVIIKVLGVAWITAIFPFYMNLIKGIIGPDLITTTQMVDGIETYTYAMNGIALSHTGFNIANVILLMPFTTFLASFLTKVMPDKGLGSAKHLKYIDVRILDTPAISIQQSQNEILRMGTDVERMLDYLKDVILSDRNKKNIQEEIFRLEEELDVVQKEIVEFLCRLLAGNVPHTVMESGRKQLRMADEYESISDYIASILKLNLKMRKSNLEMPEKVRSEILDLHQHVVDYVKFINQGVKTGNIDLMSKAMTQGDSITYLMKEYRRHHLSRVETGNTSPLKSLVITDMLNHYRRVKDHALNIAEVLAGEK